MPARTVQQSISATDQFDGTAPTGTAVFGNDMEAFPEEDVGGLFDFANKDPIQILQIAIKFGGQTSWSLVLVDIDAVEITIAAGTTETQLWDVTSRFVILQGQKLKLVTASATTAMVARISITNNIKV